jgi:hypothetical protein
MRFRSLSFFILASVMSCSSAQSDNPKEVHFGDDRSDRPAVTEMELQEDLQRFASIFIERMTQAVGDRQYLMRPLLRYSSSILDIATGPYLEVNLLDISSRSSMR